MTAFGFVVIAWVGLGAVAGRLSTQPGALTFKMWALAGLVVGAFVGFLFGIPRVLQQDDLVLGPTGGTVGSTGPTSGGPPDVPGAPRPGAPWPVGLPGYRQRVNTNLEQISDWLTKILVGIGLVELGSVPDRVRALATTLATALTPVAGVGVRSGNVPPDGLALAGAVVVYFPVLGFMGGYLLTRLFLSGAFSRADQRAQEPLVVGGQSIDIETSAEQQRSALADLQTQVASLLSARDAARSPQEAAVRGSTTPVTSHTRRVLWVDDEPSGNAEQIAILGKQGFDVSPVLSTAEALQRLEDGEHYDAFITDVGRQEDGRFVRDAGLRLLAELNARNLGPAFVYTSPATASKLRTDPRAASARIVTGSPTQLLQALGAM